MANAKLYHHGLKGANKAIVTRRLLVSVGVGDRERAGSTSGTAQESRTYLCYEHYICSQMYSSNVYSGIVLSVFHLNTTFGCTISKSDRRFNSKIDSSRTSKL